MTNVSSAATAKARSHREPEVDVRNILPETSARSSVPTSRKRNTEETIGVRKGTKKSKQVGPNHSADVVNANVNSPVTGIYVDSYTPICCYNPMTFMRHLSALVHLLHI
jgi:hypothetical protein